MVPSKLHLDLAKVPTPVGNLTIAVDREGNLRVALFTDQVEVLERQFRLHYGRNGFELHNGNPQPISRAITRYFAGELSAIDSIPVATGGTPFQREVWHALREIPCGTTISYGRLAEQIGRPAAVRAVGLANGANPIAVVVPCHRVIGANGSLIGYGGGIERKRWLLDHENRPTRLF